ncbi:MAG: hypothetical protein WCG47_29205 [Dermatophilaceae bacterium]
MRYLVLLKAVTTPDGSPPPQLMEAIMTLGQDARNAGVLLDTQGLRVCNPAPAAPASACWAGR